MSPNTYDIIIVGGGIMGSATAYYLMKADPKTGLVLGIRRCPINSFSRRHKIPLPSDPDHPLQPGANQAGDYRPARLPATHDTEIQNRAKAEPSFLKSEVGHTQTCRRDVSPATLTVGQPELSPWVIVFGSSELTESETDPIRIRPGVIAGMHPGDGDHLLLAGTIPPPVHRTGLGQNCARHTEKKTESGQYLADAIDLFHSHSHCEDYAM